MAKSDHLAAERKGAPIAAAATVLAGVLPIIGLFVRGRLVSDGPSQPILDGLARGAAGEPLENRIGQVLLLDEKAGGFLLGGVLIALGGLLSVVPFLYLHRAAMARTTDTPPTKAQWPKAAGILAIAGPIVGMIALLLYQFAVADAARAFADLPNKTVQGAIDFRQTDFVAGAGFAGFLGSFMLAVTFILVSLNAMRVGLLTRFMGVLGILIGVFTFVGAFGETGLFLPAFWFPALAPLFLLRWPTGQPPAWRSGRAEPWPTQQQVREQRVAAQKERQKEKARARPERRPADTTPEDHNGAVKPDAPATSRPSSRKKRKKR